MSRKRTSSGSQTDWDRVDAIKDEDIDLSGSPEITPGMFARAVARRDLKPVEPEKQVTLWLDADVLAWLKAQGAGYHTRINELLREYMKVHRR